MVPFHQTKWTNAFAVNKKILSILADRDYAIRDRNLGMEDTKECRDEALTKLSLIERAKALMERDSARAALLFCYGKIPVTIP